MESFVEFGFLGLFFASFLGATIIPLSSEIVLSVLLAKGYDINLSIVIATFGNWLGGLSSYYLGNNSLADSTGPENGCRCSGLLIVRR
jgi:membrane protein YqaA with SNARE-associated domain